MSIPQTPLLDFDGLCKLVKLGKDTVRKHLKSTDPAEYWPHLRIGREYRFTDAHVAEILAKCENPGPAAHDAALATTAEIQRALARRRRDRQQVA